MGVFGTCKAMVGPPRPLPPPVPRGGRIGVVSLASPLDAASFRRGVAALKAEGFQVLTAGQPAARDGYLAGDDQARLEALNQLLELQPHALVATRGGYGVMRLLSRFPWEKLIAWRGWVVGYSDLTALHAALATRFPVATLHGPMLGTLARDAAARADVLRWLQGGQRTPLFRIPRGAVVRGGFTRGVAIGGNLSLMAALVGTPFEAPYEGSVLFLEDVGEPAYRLDRLLTQLALSSRLSRVSAVVVGEMTRCGVGVRGWRSRWRRLLGEAAPQAVVVEGLPFGHGTRNRAFPLGVEVEVDTVTGTIRCTGG